MVKVYLGIIRLGVIEKVLDLVAPLVFEGIQLRKVPFFELFLQRTQDQVDGR